MRELERELTPTPSTEAPIVIVGRGRVGRSLATAAEAAAIPVRLVPTADAPREAGGATAVLLCVPDAAIAGVCESLAEVDPAPALVGHVSGATTLAKLAAAATSGRFSLHPLQTFPGPSTHVAGVPAAVAGEDDAAERFASNLAERLGMRPFNVPEEHRAAYHAAACISSNFLVTLEQSAAGLLAATGAEDPRELLAPLVLRTAANWAEQGDDALTGPIARGDAATVERHRAAIMESAPELLTLYDALAARTREIASHAVSAGGG